MAGKRVITFENIGSDLIAKWQGIADLLAKIISVPAALVMKAEDECLEVLVASKTENNPYHSGLREKWHGLYCETVIKTQKELLVPDATADSRWHKNPDIKLGMIAYLGYPINFPDKTPFGTLCVLDNKENSFSPLHRQLLLQFRDMIEMDIALLKQHILRNQAETQLKSIEWMLSPKKLQDSVDPADEQYRYGDLSELNSSGIILKSVGRDHLKDIANDYMELLGTSSAIYEKNGDYAFGIFASSWCRMMNIASRRLCNTSDNAKALNSGRWLCHESCWTDCSRVAVAEGRPVDIECSGGIRIYCEPIFAENRVVGSINFGYGDPPRDRAKLQKLAASYDLEYDALVKEAHAYESRPPFVIEMAKKRLHGTARLIGSIVEKKLSEEALIETSTRHSAMISKIGDVIGIIGADGIMQYKSPNIEHLFGWRPEDLVGSDGWHTVHPEDIERIQKEFRALLQKDKAQKTVEYRYKCKDGRYKWIELTAVNCLNDPAINGVLLNYHDITERRQALESLRETQSILQAAMDQSEAGIAIADAPSGTLRYVNDAGLLIRGGTRESIVNGIGIDKYVSSWRLLDLDGRPLRSDEVPLARAVMFGETNSREFIIRRSENEDRVVLAKAAPIKDDRGKVTAAIVVFMDITERKVAERELRTSRARLEALWNVTSLVDADLKSVSDHILESIGKMTDSPFGFYGFVNDDESVMTIHSWCGNAMNHCSMVNKPAEFKITESGIWAEAVRNRAPLILNNYEAGHPAKKGLPMGHVPLNRLLVVPFMVNGHIRSVVAVANRAAPYDETDVSQLTSFLTSIQGIIDSKRSEEALQRREIQLSQALEMGRMGHWELDAATGIFTFSDSFYSIFHTTAEEAGGYSMSVEDYTARFVHPEDSYLVKEECQKAIKTESLYSKKYLEHRVLNADGTTGHIAVRYSVEKNGNEKNIKVYGVSQDISELKRMQQGLQNTQKLESLGILAGGIAHDFNNLMSGILGYIDLASEKTREPQVSKYLAKALGSIDRARALTRQLLTFAKGGAPMKRTEQLFPFVQETVQFALSGSKVSSSFQISENLWTCDIDKNQIGQVIDNLVINAQQAMPDGGKIEISAQNISFAENKKNAIQAGNFVKLSIKDFGTGIPKEFLPRIFDPFFTTKAKGHGLGLPTCFSIVKRHGGFIEVDSERGKGSTFHVYLPASKDSVSAVANESSIEFKGTGTFLVMDDEEVVRDTVRDILESFGYSVELKMNGESAVAWFAEEIKAGRTVAGVIFDLTIPGGMGGREAIGEIRKLCLQTPVFVASGYSEDPVMANPKDYGFSASICKPFKRAELMKMLSETMKAKK